MGGSRFAYQIAAVGEQGLSDAEMYREAVIDATLLCELGYDAAWIVEHHFSDYFPHPNPLMFLSHLAAELPGFGLGTAVMVLPWYNPIRFVEDLSMLAALSTGPLHIGMGRGTAKSEYDAFGVNMAEARERFRETWEFTRAALAGDAVAYDGKHVQVPRPLRIRPRVEASRIQFYGAIGSLESAEVMGELDLPPLCLATFPDHLLARILTRWQDRMRARGCCAEATFPISIKGFVAPTEEEARELALTYFPRYFQLQVDHYQADQAPWGDIPGYEQFNRIFGNLKKLTEPANLGPYMEMNLVGSPEMVARRVRALEAIGFNYFLISNATIGVPRRVRHQTIRLFADEVVPRLREARVVEVTA
ncbi:MAG TPA: LLM class flavin-dependent oxidoreductase [Acetobacteraceae bacterium]